MLLSDCNSFEFEEKVDEKESFFTDLWSIDVSLGEKSWLYALTAFALAFDGDDECLHVELCFEEFDSNK